MKKGLNIEVTSGQYEFLIKVEHTIDEQFYNKFVKQIGGKLKWVVYIMKRY